MAEAHNKILIVEDDAGIAAFLKTAIHAAGYDVLLADTGAGALSIISSHCPDCILLDLGLPDMDGSTIIESVRQWTQTPIVVISARDAELDKAAALDQGADDYMVKPFGTVELLARIRSALRHTRTTAECDQVGLTGTYSVGDMVIDYKKLRVYIQGADAQLTPNEFQDRGTFGEASRPGPHLPDHAAGAVGSGGHHGQQDTAGPRGQHPAQDRGGPQRAPLHLHRDRRGLSPGGSVNAVFPFPAKRGIVCMKRAAG